MKTENAFPFYKFKNSDDEYSILTSSNKNVLAKHMESNNLKKLIITSDEDEIGWNETYLPDLNEFEFIEELLIYWTNIKDITNIHSCKNLKVLWLDNDDTTKIDFQSFSKIEKIITWNRKGIDTIWNIPTLKSLTIANVKAKDYHSGSTLNSLNKLRVLKSNVEDLSFLSKAKNISFLELLSLSKLKDISFIEKMESIQHLRIDVNNIEDFSSIEKLSNITSCYLASKKGRLSIDYFKSLKKIEKFNFRGNNNMISTNKELKSRIN